MECKKCINEVPDDATGHAIYCPICRKQFREWLGVSSYHIEIQEAIAKDDFAGYEDNQHKLYGIGR